MPQSGSGAGKNDEFYDVCRQIPYRDWKAFARGESYLGLPANVMDDIDCDYHHQGIMEIKFQTLLKWERRSGSAATVECLKEKANRYLGTVTPQTSESVQSQSDTSPSSSASRRSIDSETSTFRRLLIKISTKLNSSDFELIKAYYCNVVPNEQGNVAAYLIYLEDNNLWDENPSTFNEKLSCLYNLLTMIERNDLLTEIPDLQRSFLDADTSGVAAVENSAPGEVPDLLRSFDNVALVDGPSNAVTHSGFYREAGEQCQESSDSSSLNSTSKTFMDQTGSPNTTFNDRSGDLCSFDGIEVVVEPSSKDFYNSKQADVCLREVYKVNSTPKGHAIIISNINFPGWGEGFKRVGGRRDCQLMENLFGRNGLGLQVTVKEDLSRDSMWRNLEEFASSPCHAAANMCVVLIMSHGKHFIGEGDGIYGTDGRYILAEHVVRLFDNDNCPLLREKPKMFFFQFCRGDSADRGVKHHAPETPYPEGELPKIPECLERFEQTDDQADGHKHLPQRTDVLIAYATQQGHLSFRSWFTNALANVFSEKAKDTHVCDMLKGVKRALAARVSSSSNPNFNNCKEMADVRDILLKNVYFFPGHP